MRRFRKYLLITVFLAVFVYVIPPSSKSEQFAHATRTQPDLSRTGTASWYSKRSPGIKKHTANNEIFDDQTLTAAMWDVRFNQKVRVTNLENGKSIVVRINDRGPHRRLTRKGRVIDLTKRAFSEIGSTKEGLIQVKLEFL